jgi:hypothetical protein
VSEAIVLATALAFMLAQSLHIALKAAAAKASALNGIAGYRDYLKHHGAFIAARLAFALCLLLFWFQNPDVLTAYVTHLDWVRRHLGQVRLPLNPATAFIVGYCLDSLLDKLPVVAPFLRPWLAKEVPPRDDPRAR